MKARSYFAFVRAADGHLLLGGVKSTESVRFESETDAKTWMYQCVETNKGANRDVAFCTVFASNKVAEVEEQDNGKA